MTDPKPVKMWAVYAPDGELVERTVSTKRSIALHRLCGAPQNEDSETWKWHCKKGYTMRRVTITPDTPCTWTEDTKDCGVWHGTCGICWTFEDGTPDDNKVNFCPRCGARRVTITPDPESEK